MPAFISSLPGWVYLIGIELAVLLLGACLYLLFHVKGLRGLIAALEERLLALRDTLRGARQDAQSARLALAEARRQNRDYVDFIEEQITATRNQHQSLSPDRDIVLDIAPDASLQRQALALRHALLIAEKEAWHAGDGKQCDWEVLDQKLGQIITFYQQPALDDIDDDTFDAGAVAEVDLDAPSGDAPADALAEQTIANLRHQVANLERFRALYFAGEAKWQQASNRAETCHEQLLLLGDRLGAGDDYRALLTEYRGAYAELGDLLAEGADGGDVELPAQHSVGRLVIANQEEIQRLRNMAVDQHKVIQQLKRQLVDASTLEQKDAAIEALHQQLERQERFLQESDTCTRLLEDELERALHENQQLKQQSGGAADDDLHQLVADLTRESRDMLAALGAMQEENEGLREQLQQGGGADNLRDKLSEAQQELLNLQTRHLELEERYLELKSQGQ